MKNSSNFVLELTFWKLLSIIVFVGIGILCTRSKSSETVTQSHKVDSTYVEDINRFTQTIDGVHFVSPSGAEPGTDTYTIELIKANNPDWTWEECEKFMWENN